MRGAGRWITSGCGGSRLLGSCDTVCRLWSSSEARAAGHEVPSADRGALLEARVTGCGLPSAMVAVCCHEAGHAACSDPQGCRAFACL